MVSNFWLQSWSWDLIEKLTVSQPLKKFTALVSRVHRFITMLWKSMTQVNQVHISVSYSLKFPFIIFLLSISRSPSAHFPSNLPTKTLPCMPLVMPLSIWYWYYLVRITHHEAYHYVVFSCHLIFHPSYVIFFSATYTKTPSAYICCSDNITDQVSQPSKTACKIIMFIVWSYVLI